MRLLLEMALVKAGGRRSRLGASGKTRPPGCDVELREDLFDTPVDKAPGAHVLRLLLAPHDLGVAVALQHPCQRIVRERIELLDANQRDPPVAVCRSGFQKIE